MNVLLMVVMMMLGMWVPAMAGTVTVEYIEPGTDVDGKPLSDLKEVVIRLKQDTAAEKLITIPATSPAGGKPVSKVITVADPPACGKTTITVTAESVDTSNNHGPKAGPVSTVRDVSGLPACKVPKAPSGLKVVQP